MKLKQSEKDYCERLLYFKTINDCHEYLQIQLELLFSTIAQHHQDSIANQAEADARIFLQSYSCRLLNFNHILKGVSFDSGGIKLNTIIDPSVLFTEVRGLFESLCVFELVFCVPDTPEKQDLIYKLFSIAGKYERQQMHISDGELKKALEVEKTEMEKQIAEVKSSVIYQSLDAKNKQKVDNNISNGKFRIYIDENNNIVGTKWDDCRKYFGMDKPIYDDMYRYFSLHSHPSIIAIRQFEMAFQRKNPEFVKLAKLAVRYAVSITSIFIADYLKKYPNSKSNFDILPPYKQMLIDYYNCLTRGEEYALFID